MTGDDLGQVASQTLQNLAVTSRAVTLPILRPLISFDKGEVVQIAQALGTYELSIQPTRIPARSTRTAPQPGRNSRPWRNWRRSSTWRR